jgi:hypothetical protein
MAAGEHFQETEVEVRLRWAANCHLPFISFISSCRGALPLPGLLLDVERLPPPSGVGKQLKS